jgi:hypothetical protein
VLTRRLQFFLFAACVAGLLWAGVIIPAQEKSDSRSRRAVTTTEWPSLRGVLAVEDVRHLLQVNDEEQEEIRLFVEGKRSRQRESDRNTDELPLPDNAPAWQIELRRQERRLKRILGDERYVRIRQLQAQAGGLAAAFTRDDPSLQLAVSPEQRNQARKEIRAAADKMMDRFRSVPGDRFVEQARLRTELYEHVAPELQRLLTDEQKAKWAEKTGEPAAETLNLQIRTLGGR